MPQFVTIVNGIFTVPIKRFYVFERSSERMEWLNGQGYNFEGVLDSHTDGASIPYDREDPRHSGWKRLSNHTLSTVESKSYINITDLIDEQIQATQPYTFW